MGTEQISTHSHWDELGVIYDLFKVNKVTITVFPVLYHGLYGVDAILDPDVDETSINPTDLEDFLNQRGSAGLRSSIQGTPQKVTLKVQDPNEWYSIEDESTRAAVRWALIHLAQTTQANGVILQVAVFEWDLTFKKS